MTEPSSPTSGPVAAPAPAPAPAPPDANAPGPAAPASRWEDFIDIFYAPADVFRRRAASGFGIPMLVVAVAMAVLAFTNSGVMQPIMDAEFARQTQAILKQNPNIPTEGLQRMKTIGESIQRFGTIVVVPLTLLILGLVTWLVSRLVDSRQTVQASILIACYAWVVRVVEQVVYGVEGLIMSPDQLTSHYAVQLGPARFFNVDATSPVLMAVLGRIDLFTIWVTVLLAIGAYVIGKLSRNRAIIAGVLFWLVGALPTVFGALRQQA